MDIIKLRDNVINGKDNYKDLNELVNKAIEKVVKKQLENEDIDVVLRPEDIDIVSKKKGNVTGEIVSKVFNSYKPIT